MSPRRVFKISSLSSFSFTALIPTWSRWVHTLDYSFDLPNSLLLIRFLFIFSLFDMLSLPTSIYVNLCPPLKSDAVHSSPPGFSCHTQSYLSLLFLVSFDLHSLQKYLLLLYNYYYYCAVWLYNVFLVLWCTYIYMDYGAFSIVNCMETEHISYIL